MAPPMPEIRAPEEAMVTPANAATGVLGDPLYWCSLGSKKHVGSSASQQYFDVLGLLAKVGDVSGAARVIEQMEKDGMTVHRTALNNVISACAKSGHVASAEMWLNRMMKAGQLPNRTTYSSVIMACVCSGDLPRAESWIERMHESGFTASKGFSYQILRILADLRSGATQVDRASKWLLRIHEMGVALDRATINLLMKVYARNGDVHQTERWALLMNTAGIAPNRSTLSALVMASARGGDAERAGRWRRRMAQLGFQEEDDPSGAQSPFLSETSTPPASDLATIRCKGEPDNCDAEELSPAFVECSWTSDRFPNAPLRQILSAHPLPPSH